MESVERYDAKLRNMLDPTLDLLVWVLPFLLSVLALFLTLEPLNERYKPHKWKWRIGLVAFGAGVSLMSYWQQTRQRAKAASDVHDLQEQALHLERESERRTEDLKRQFNTFVAESLRHKSAAVISKTPTADEIAAELDKRLSAHLQPPSSTTEKPPVEQLPTKPIPGPVSPPADPPIIRPCRDDDLNECSDEQLLENLKPLLASILAISDEYSAATKKLDDIKGGKMDWVRILASTGGDKDSKWLKGLENARRDASQRFRDCCAERTLLYHKEFLLRDHKRADDAGLYEWVQNLLKPIGSKEWKKARDEGTNVGTVYFDLDFFRIDLEYVVAIRHIEH
jgi:hypothetical protein